MTKIAPESPTLAQKVVHARRWIELEEARGIRSPKLRHRHSPRVLLLDRQGSLEQVGDAIAQGEHPVVDFGATYGDAFRPDLIREEIARARLEREPREVVSIVATIEQLRKWIDMNQLSELQRQAIETDLLELLRDVAFVRFPANAAALKDIDPTCINSKGEIQVFPVSDADPLLNYLSTHHDLKYYAVRSTNFAGQAEASTAPLAIRYAQRVAAKYVGVPSRSSLVAQRNTYDNIDDAKALKDTRNRIGSQPIIYLPAAGNTSEIIIVRAANTTASTLKRLLAHYSDQGLQVSYEPEKPEAKWRVGYDSPQNIVDPLEIRADLLRASNIATNSNESSF